MPGPITLILLLGAGFGLGLFFFGGLWFTVRTLPKSRHPAPIMLTSLLLRTVAVLAGMNLLMDGRWQRVLACLAGFILARVAFSRWIPRDDRTGRKMA